MRLETMVLMAVDVPVGAIRSQIASSVDIIVHLGRLRDGSRKVLKIAEIKELERSQTGEHIVLNTLYEFMQEGVMEDGRVAGSLKKTQAELIHKEKLLAAAL